MQDVHGVPAVLAGGVDVASDVEPVPGDVVAGQAAGNLLLGFSGRTPRSLMLFVGQTLVFPAKRTWFRTGAYLGRDRILHQFRQEYCGGTQDTPEPVLPRGITEREAREAVLAPRVGRCARRSSASTARPTPSIRTSSWSTPTT